MLASSQTGVARDPCQIFQVVEVVEVVGMSRTGLDQFVVAASTMQVLRWVTVDENTSQMMAKLETSLIGNEKDHSLHCHRQIDHHNLEMEDAHARMIMHSETEKTLRLHGVKDEVRVRKKVQDHQDASSRRDQSSREHLLQPSRTINGAQRCDLMYQLLSLQHLHREMAAKLLLLRLTCQQLLSADPD